MKENGRAIPQLELPTVRLYGKDGAKGGMELPVTAQVLLTFKVNNKSVSVPVLVQPNSEQACLLGWNAIPLFGIKLVYSNGKLISPQVCAGINPCSSDCESEEEAASVNLVRSVAIPSQKG